MCIMFVYYKSLYIFHSESFNVYVLVQGKQALKVTYAFSQKMFTNSLH